MRGRPERLMPLACQVRFSNSTASRSLRWGGGLEEPLGDHPAACQDAVGDKSVQVVEGDRGGTRQGEPPGSESRQAETMGSPPVGAVRGQGRRAIRTSKRACSIRPPALGVFGQQGQGRSTGTWRGSIVQHFRHSTPNHRCSIFKCWERVLASGLEAVGALSTLQLDV